MTTTTTVQASQPDGEPGGVNEGREIRGVERYEWEQIVVRRARWRGVIAGSDSIGKNGKPTKGAVSPTTVRAIAAVIASYSNIAGREVFPGDARIAVETETDLKTVKRVRGYFVTLGLLMPDATPGPRKRSDNKRWRLALPSNLFEVLTVIDPEQVVDAAKEVRTKARGKHNAGGPTDPSVGTALGVRRTPRTPPRPRRLGGPTDPQKRRLGGPTEPHWGVRRTRVPSHLINHLSLPTISGSLSVRTATATRVPSRRRKPIPKLWTS